MKKLRQGFTLIELIIVLAIAGLIISLVFVAASAAQRNGRDTTRRADAQKLATAIEQWSANNNGALPDGTTDDIFSTTAPNSLFTAGYLDATKFRDPSTGVTYRGFGRAGFDVNGNPQSYQFAAPGQMYYVKNGDSYTIVTPLESGKYTYTP